MVEFSSIIVFDSETTSLPHLDYNTTEIVELAFLGCEVRHLNDRGELPRPLSKLVLIFNPNKLIHPNATSASGLDNELLKTLKPFEKEDADLLKQFISRLPSPVCIVAHNGDKFDFPILRRKLVTLNTVLGNNVYCADSIKAFREIYPKSKVQTPSTKREVCLEHLKKTPPNQKTIPTNILHSKKQKISEVTRELFPDHNVDVGPQNWMCTQSEPSFLFSLTSYKLRDVYSFLHGKSFKNAHRAENDAAALLSCIIQCEKFLDWMSSHAVIFDSIPPLF